VIDRVSAGTDGRWWRLGSVVLLLGGVTGVVGLHRLRPDLPAGSHRISEYALGRHGWLMAASFVAVGCGLAALAVAVLAVRNARRRLPTAVLLGIAGAGMAIAGLFRTDELRSGITADAIHSAASAVSTMAVIAAGGWWALVTARSRGWFRATTSLAAVGAVLGASSPALHHSALTGLSQRALWATLIAWALALAIELGELVPRRISDASAAGLTIDA
jgi:hypothetical protein